MRPVLLPCGFKCELDEQASVHSREITPGEVCRLPLGVLHVHGQGTPTPPSLHSRQAQNLPVSPGGLSGPKSLGSRPHCPLRLAATFAGIPMPSAQFLYLENGTSIANLC